MTHTDRELAIALLRAWRDDNDDEQARYLVGHDPAGARRMVDAARASGISEPEAKSGPPGDQVPIPQNVMQARGMLLVAENWLTAHDPKFKADAPDELAALRAENERLLEVLKNIEELHIPRPLGKTFRRDGVASKHDTCAHGVLMYEECADCISEFVRAALSSPDAREA